MKDGTYQYALGMTVPLGKRKGILRFTLQNQRIQGALTMFTNTAPIAQGGLVGNRIWFAGTMKTLLSTIAYRAEGTVTRSNIKLVFRTSNGNYPADGRQNAMDFRRLG